jgi:hypothetical protein
MAEKPTEETTEAVDAPVEATEITDEQLTIQDLVVLRNCIEVCTKRGAFQADELETIGVTYKKLHGFLSSVIVPQQPTPAPVTQPDIPPVPETATEPEAESIAEPSKEAKAEAKKFEEINKAALAEESNGESK